MTVPRAESAGRIDAHYAAYRWLGMRWVGYPAPRRWLDRLGVTGPRGPLRWPTRLVVFAALLLWKVLALLTWPVRYAARSVMRAVIAAADRMLPRGPHEYPGCGCVWRLKRWSIDPWAIFRVRVDRWSPKAGDALDRRLFALDRAEAERLIQESKGVVQPPLRRRLGAGADEAAGVAGVAAAAPPESGS